MRYFALAPEVPGGLGPKTVMDSSTRPPTVTILHYEVQGWLGDDIIESYPCFLVSPEVGVALQADNLRGVQLDRALITWGEEIDDAFYDRAANSRVLDFQWMRPTSRAGKDDVAMDASGTLVVSERALEVLRGFTMNQCQVDPWEPERTANPSV